MGILDLVFNEKCIFCGAKGNDICEKCLLESRKYAKFQNDNNNLIFAYKYKDFLREAFLQYKFYGKKHYSKAFVKLFLQNDIVDFNKYDIITYVPISNIRMRERGFNQSELLCRGICEKYEIKSQKILKRKHSKAQSTLTKQQRENNISNKFFLEKDINNKKILVFDDIYTTGTTMNEVMQVLKSGNAKSVTWCTLFRS